MLKTYKLPNIRCINCNTPIAHLYNLYNDLIALNFTSIEAFDTLGMNKYCCRAEISRTINIPLLTCIDSKMKDVNVVKYSIIHKEFYEIEIIENDIMKGCIPLKIKTSNVIKMLNDTIHVTYVDESVYLAR